MKSLTLEYKGADLYRQTSFMAKEFDVLDYQNMEYYRKYILPEVEQQEEIEEDEGECNVV